MSREVTPSCDTILMPYIKGPDSAADTLKKCLADMCRTIGDPSSRVMEKG